MSLHTETMQRDLLRLGLKIPLQVSAGDESEKPLATAVGQLQALLADHGIECRIAALPKSPGILLETLATASPDLVAGRPMGEASPEHDAYQIIQAEAGSDVHVIGSNPRSVVYGVYAFYDLLQQEVEPPLNVFERAFFKHRIMCPTIEGRSDNPDNLAYLSRMGVNTTFLRARMCPITDVKHFFFYVRDDEHVPGISKHNPPNPEIVKMASGCYRFAQGYGLDTIIFMDEPVAVAPKDKKDQQEDMLIPETLAELDADMVGEPATVRYREDGWKALSVFHPKIEQHYEAMMSRIMELFPRLSLLYLYNEDAGASNCTPQSDPRAQEQYPAGYTGFPYRAYNHLAELLQNTARTYRPDFRVLIPTFHWGMDSDARPRFLGDLPRDVAVDLVAYNDCVPFVSKMPDWGRELCRTLEARPDVDLMCEDDFTGTNEDQLREVTAGYPMPLRTWKKMHVYAQAGAVGVIQHHVGGPTFGANSLNDLAWRIFSWNPLMNEEEARATVRRLLLAQFGSTEAAEKMGQACDAVDRCLDADEAGSADRPYQARFGHGLQNLFADALLFSKQAYLATSLDRYFSVGWEGRAERWLETLRREVAALCEAVRCAREAVALTPTDRKPRYIYREWPALTDCRAYATGIAEAIQTMLCFKRSMMHRLVFSGIGGAGEEEIAAARAAEIENCREMRKALAARRPWLQSPSGQRTMALAEQVVSKKLAAMENEAV